MSILIKGMEMPTSCGKCKIKNAIKCNRWELVRSVLLDRHRDCPLVPVPPHGRLIDADAILGKINAIISAHPDEADLYEQDAVIVRDWLRSEPTIIEREKT